MNEDEIRDQLKEKNKEIYLNKLNLDLTNNLEVLVLSIDNLLNLINNDTKSKILGITESFQNETIIKQNIDKFFEKYRLSLMNLIDNKKETIENMFDINNIDIYKEKLEKTNEKIKEKLDNIFKEDIDNLTHEIVNLYDDTFCKTRIKEYLESVFLKNLNNKILETIKSRDIILLNTFNETYNKYLELNKNTIEK